MNTEDEDLWGDFIVDNQGATDLFDFEANYPNLVTQNEALAEEQSASVSPRNLRRTSKRVPTADMSLALSDTQPQWPAQASQAPGHTGLTMPRLIMPSYAPPPVQGSLGHSHVATANSYLPNNSYLPGNEYLPDLGMSALGMPPPPSGGPMLPPSLGGPMPRLPPPPPARPSQSPRTWRSPSLRTAITHARKTKFCADNDPSTLYARFPAQPTWGPTKGRAKAPLFQYYKGGPELYPNQRYSKEELWTFFAGAGRPASRQGMTLWIQSTPSQVNYRYQASSASSKCRYRDCPIPKGTILKGFFRVALDEFADLTTEGAADPFHNAGYLHLYCFEELFDLGLLLHTAHAFYGFRVAADARNHRFEDRNPMAITHHHKDLGAIFSHWKQSHQPRACAIWPTARDPDNGGRQPRLAVHAKSTLWYALTRAQLSLEPKNRRLRDQRGGANLERHRGDLRIFLAIKSKMKADSRAANGRDDDDDDDNDAPVPGSSAADPLRLSWSTSSHSTARSPSPPPAPKRKRKRPAPRPDPINTELASADFEPDPSWYVPAPPHQHISPQDEVRRLYAHPGAARMTRKRSREAAQAIFNAVATTPRITRRQTAEIEGLLAQQPVHVQEQVLAAVTPVLPGFLGWDDELEERVGRLAKRQRREVSGFVAKRENGGDWRRIQSYDE
ncbi:hypothetical protein B0T18DRAFT_394876 [Schizothecium vesticola]|uniref:Uncharacterized protein n=1 Tax=Schizothecium vesticola TaxID=314040 RepID=A0AA40BQN5_9PEZI|nr:hypothetical protein B0T18DRAFT_394876 [Schizothecium vesticola]